MEDLRKQRETKIEVKDRSPSINKIKSDTLISIKEKRIIDKITKKKQENQKDAKKKLVWVSIICVFFIIIETVGGYYSGSISIWSDAARKFLFQIIYSFIFLCF